MTECKANTTVVPAPTQLLSASVAGDPEAYCSDCGIQFMARETLLGHKKFYCSKQKLGRLTDSEDSPPPRFCDSAEREFTSKAASARRSPLSSSSANGTSGGKKNVSAVSAAAAAAAAAAVAAATDGQLQSVANWMQFSTGFPSVLLPPPLVLATPILTNVGIQYVPVTPASSPANVLPLIGSRSSNMQSCMPFSPFGMSLLVPPVGGDQQSGVSPRERSPTQVGDADPARKSDCDGQSTPPAKRQRCHDEQTCKSPSETDRSAGRHKASLPDRPASLSSPHPPACDELEPELDVDSDHVVSASERTSPKCGSEAALDLTVRNNENVGDLPSSVRVDDKSEFVCDDCNVTFHKRENLIAHRTLYCARRLRPLTEQDAHTAVSASLRAVAPYLTVKNSDYQHASKPSALRDNDAIESDASAFHQCLPCGIKFKSLRTLEAHQEYYCPYRHDVSLMKTPDMRKLPNRARVAEQLRSSGSQNGKAARSTSDYAPNEPKRQPGAAAVRSPSASSNKPCDSENAGVIALRRTFKCDFCDESFVSLEHLAEHFRTHAIPICYSCNLCGYRGNTVRGLKIHGKLHADQGILFTEENIAVIRKLAPGENGMVILSALRSPQDPIPTTGGSRKDKDKDSEPVGITSATAPASTTLPISTSVSHSTSKPSQDESDASGKLIRRKSTQATAAETDDDRRDLNKSLFTCDRCQSQFLDEENFLMHKRKICAQLRDSSRVEKQNEVAEIEVRTKEGSINQRNESDENSNCSRSLATPSPPPTQVVVIPGGGLAVRVSSNNSLNALKRSSAKLCRSCGVSFSHLTTYVSHKKYYCRKRRSWQSSVITSAANTVQEATDHLA